MVKRSLIDLAPSKIDINPSNMSFVQQLRSSNASTIFLVVYQGHSRALKVFPNHGDLGFESNGRDMCRFRSEATAYQTLKASGYASGYIPDFYGCAVVDPTQFLPHLDAFLGDKYFPDAVLMEYLPNPKPVTSVTYEERMKMAVEGIHYGLVEHNDPYPRNIMIVQGDPDRVLWIAFDMSVTYAAVSGSITKNMLENFKFESDYVLEYGLCLAQDQKDDLPPNTRFYS